MAAGVPIAFQEVLNVSLNNVISKIFFRWGASGTREIERGAAMTAWFVNGGERVGRRIERQIQWRCFS